MKSIQWKNIFIKMEIYIHALISFHLFFKTVVCAHSSIHTHTHTHTHKTRLPLHVMSGNHYKQQHGKKHL